MTRKILLSIVLAIALLSIEASAKGNSEQMVQQTLEEDTQEHVSL